MKLKIISQYLTLSILISIIWILKLPITYSIISNIICLVIFIPLFKLFKQPSKLRIYSDYSDSVDSIGYINVYFDFKKTNTYLTPKNKRTIIFYMWFLIWIPVYHKEYTFSTNEDINNVIRECSYEYIGLKANNKYQMKRILEEIDLEEKDLNGKLVLYKKNNKTLWL